jgi:hypothetical protein
MAYGTRVAFDAVRELAFSGISAAYATVGTPLGDNVRLLSVSNSTNEEVYISFDGSTDHLRIVSNSFKLFDLSANKIRDDGLFIAVGTQIYVKEVTSTPTSGSVWIEAMSAEGGK